MARLFDVSICSIFQILTAISYNIYTLTEHKSFLIPINIVARTTKVELQYNFEIFVIFLIIIINIQYTSTFSLISIEFRNIWVIKVDKRKYIIFLALTQFINST